MVVREPSEGSYTRKKAEKQEYNKKNKKSRKIFYICNSLEFQTCIDDYIIK